MSQELFNHFNNSIYSVLDQEASVLKNHCLVFADHFCNDDIFISFRIVCTQLLQGNFVTFYDEFKHQIKTVHKYIPKLRYANALF